MKEAQQTAACDRKFARESSAHEPNVGHKIMKRASQIGCLVALCLGVGVLSIVIWFLWGFAHIFDPVRRDIDLKAWARVEHGMTKTQVSNILGAPLTVEFALPTPTNLPRPVRYPHGFVNYWQYNVGGTAGWEPPYNLVPHPEAYIVDFDTNDVVVRLTMPGERNKMIRGMANKPGGR